MTTVATGTEKWVPELTFGARLALVRHRMGWNVKEAAAACGLPAQSWRGWEIAGHLPRRYVEIAKTISTQTGVDYYWLVFGPEGGGGETTRQYFQDARLLAAVGEPHPSIRRPVKRTRPRAHSRPLTPTAA